MRRATRSNTRSGLAGSLVGSVFAVGVAGSYAMAGGCGGQSAALGAADGGGSSSSGSTSANACPPCVTNADCGGGVCGQLGGDSYCAPACSATSACSPDRQCAMVTDVSGNHVSLCVPRGGVCAVTGTSPDAGSGPGDTCGNLVGPSVTAGCHCSTGKTCSANGCYGGYWCNTGTNRCENPPASCTSGSSSGSSSGGGSGPGVPFDGGAPPSGTVGATGGSVSRLYFGIVGDTRPPNEDDTSGYPTAIITQIYQHIEALSPRPSFVVSTGDYQFASPTGTEGATQLDLYDMARANYSGTEFPTMGNHECTGYTNSNCGSGNPDGITNNYTSYLQKLLTPIGQTNPYYEIDVNASDGSWTAKFLFVAANAWTQTQANWLAQAMGRATTYTFLIRHEPASVTSPPGVTPSENIMAMHPYTLSIVGHNHTYGKTGAREVTIGNGGAPLTGSKDYGFGMASQQADGSIAVDMIDYSSGLADSSFHFAVNADGSAAP